MNQYGKDLTETTKVLKTKKIANRHQTPGANETNGLESWPNGKESNMDPQEYFCST